MTDLITHPTHYLSHPSGLECIDVVRDLNFLVGNAIKYCWRAGQKGDRLEDLRKAWQYLEWAIEDGQRVLLDQHDFITWFLAETAPRAEDMIIWWILNDELGEAMAELENLIIAEKFKLRYPNG